MKSSTGIVMQLNKQHAFVMTNTGEFLKLRLSKNPPQLGEEYTGEVLKESPFYKYALTAATLAFLVFFSSTAYAYYTPVSSVVVDINPSIRLDLNRWNRIIKSTPLNEDGKKVLSELKVQNKSLNDGLDSIVVQAKKDNFIDSTYTEDGKTITIDIKSSKQIEDFSLSKFEENIKSSNINLKITTSENNKTYDKIDISTSKNEKPKDSEKDNKPKDNNSSNNNNNKEEPNSNKPKKNENSNTKKENYISPSITLPFTGRDGSSVNSSNSDDKYTHDKENNKNPHKD
jgi:hypothetical protein